MAAKTKYARAGKCWRAVDRIPKNAQRRVTENMTFATYGQLRLDRF